MPHQSQPKDQGPQIKNDRVYEKLREKGDSKEKAARVANAQAARGGANPAKGGKATPYEDWSRADLYAKAQKIGVDGRSKMTKDQLIHALRNH